MSEKYTYSVSSDTLNGQVNTDRLTLEVRDSPIVIALDYISVTGDVIDIWFKAALDATQEIVLDGIVATHTGEALPNPTNSDGIPYTALHGKANAVQVVGRDDAVDYIRATHNWCDRCTWFQESARIIDAQLAATLDPLVWASLYTHWIDLTHGRQNSEETWIADQKTANPTTPHGYAVIITVGGVLQIERELGEANGDYVVDYEAGTIAFFNPPATAPVAAFSYAQGSSFCLLPAAGKVIEIQEASAHLSVDFEWLDTIIMAIEVPHPVNAGEWVVAGQNVYKTLYQFVDDSTFMAPPIPAQGGVRGLAVAMQALPIPYASVRKLLSSMEMRLRVYLLHDRAWAGTRVTATFKSVSYDET